MQCGDMMHRFWKIQHVSKKESETSDEIQLRSDLARCMLEQKRELWVSESIFYSSR